MTTPYIQGGLSRQPPAKEDLGGGGLRGGGGVLDAAGPAARKLAATVTAGVVAEASTFPVDLCKTRMQLAAELGRRRPGAPAPRGPLDTFAAIVRAEGLAGLYRGVEPALARHVPYTGTRILVYEALREHQGGAGYGLGSRVATGALAGATAQLTAVPLDLVKVRMQADGQRVLSGELRRPRYTGIGHALTSIVREEGGVRGLWKGSAPAVQRAALVNMGELVSYETAKEQLVARAGWRADETKTHLVSALVSGFCATVASAPADIVKTRLMNQDPSAPLYKSSVDCLMQTVRHEGVLGLYKGFIPTWARLGPWQLTFWVVYERLRLLSMTQ